MPEGEPDRELSPIKEKECINFDIYSDAADSVHVADDNANDLLMKCKELATSIRSSLKHLQLQKEYKAYDELVLATFGDILESCPRSPKTALSRDEISRKYNKLHHSRVWLVIVKKFHEGTGDPVSKSDMFLEVAHIIVDLWNEIKHVWDVELC